MQIVEVDQPQPGDIMYDTKPFWGHAGIIKAPMGEKNNSSSQQSKRVLVAHMTNQGGKAHEFNDLRHEKVSTEGLKYYRITGEGADAVQKMLLSIVHYDKVTTVDEPLYRPRWMDRGHNGISRTIKKFAQTVVKNDTGDTKTISSIEKQLKNLCKQQSQKRIALDCSAYVFSRLQLALVLTTQNKMTPQPTTKHKTNSMPYSMKTVRALCNAALDDIKKENGALKKTVRRLPSVLKGTSSRFARPKKLLNKINGAIVFLPGVTSLRPSALTTKDTKSAKKPTVTIKNQHKL